MQNTATVLLLSEPALACLCTLESSTGKSSWDRTTNAQEDHPGLMEESHGTIPPPHTHTAYAIMA